MLLNEEMIIYRFIIEINYLFHYPINIIHSLHKCNFTDKIIFDLPKKDKQKLDIDIYVYVIKIVLSWMRICFIVAITQPCVTLLFMFLRNSPPKNLLRLLQ